jgi:hypothetical protein
VLVSAIDWPAMLAQLEQQRIVLDQERQDVDAVIETVRRRAGGVVPAGLTLPPPRNGGKRATKAVAKNGGKGRVSDDQVATMRRLFEDGAAIAAVAKGAHVSEPTVRTYAKAGKWKRPAIAKAATGKAAPKATDVVQLSGSVKCTSCDLWTKTDPCEKCGSKLKRKGW